MREKYGNTYRQNMEGAREQSTPTLTPTTKSPSSFKMYKVLKHTYTFRHDS